MITLGGMMEMKEMIENVRPTAEGGKKKPMLRIVFGTISSVWAEPTGASDAHDAYADPEDVQHRVCCISFEDGAPGEHDRVDRVEDPNEHEGAFGAKPTDEGEAEDAHEDADHFDDPNVTEDEVIEAPEPGGAFGRWGQQIARAHACHPR
ncbi:MAG: hypothetical protein N2039_06780 [Gemmataceae bacterium]|nr:hypothetical protein [Gemmataceae bacterium]